MNTPKTIFAAFTVTLIAAGGLLVAQTTRQHQGVAHLEKLSAALNLTDQQKQQAMSIFQEERAAAKPIRQSLKQEHAGKSPEEVQQLAQTDAPQLAQLATVHAAALTKLNAILTPDQQQKFASMHHRERAKQ